MRLQITEADHEANAFWTLDDDVKHEAPAEVVFAALPEQSCGRPPTHERSCFIADLLNDGGDLVDDREIAEEVAQALLDEPIAVLRDRFRTMLFEVYGATG